MPHPTRPATPEMQHFPRIKNVVPGGMKVELHLGTLLAGLRSPVQGRPRSRCRRAAAKSVKGPQPSLKCIHKKRRFGRLHRLLSARVGAVCANALASGAMHTSPRPADRARLAQHTPQGASGPVESVLKVWRTPGAACAHFCLEQKCAFKRDPDLHRAGGNPSLYRLQTSILS